MRWPFATLYVWLGIAAWALAGCASQAPDVLTDVHSQVNSRASYARYNALDQRVLKQGDSGNCAAFAYTYQSELMSRGVASLVKTCVLKSGESHAYTKTFDGWVLDVRSGWVVRENEVGCKEKNND